MFCKHYDAQAFSAGCICSLSCSRECPCSGSTIPGTLFHMLVWFSLPSSLWSTPFAITRFKTNYSDCAKLPARVTTKTRADYQLSPSVAHHVSAHQTVETGLASKAYSSALSSTRIEGECHHDSVCCLVPPCLPQGDSLKVMLQDIACLASYCHPLTVRRRIRCREGQEALVMR